MRAVDDHGLAVGRKARVRIASPLTPVLPRRNETPERHPAPARDVVEIRMLLPLTVGIRVVEDPLVARQVAAVPVSGHDALADELEHGAAIAVQPESRLAPFGTGPSEHVLRVAPDEVRGMP